jgi:lipoprotein LpqH
MFNRQWAVIAVAASCAGLLLAGCGENTTTDEPARSASPTTVDIPHADVTATVDGAALPGVDMAQLFCSRMGSIILTGQDPTDGRPGLVAQLQPGNPPTLGYVSFGMDGVLYTAKPGKGTATVTVTDDGKRITIVGTAESYEPAANPLTKTFQVSATCD